MKNALLLTAVLILGLGAIWGLDRLEVRNWEQSRNIELRSAADALQLRLSGTIEHRFNALAALAALFVIDPDTGPREFAEFASTLQRFNEPIRALQYADPETRVVYVYPPKGNEITIAEPMLLLADEKRGPFVRKALDEHRAVLQGPFELRQGGQGAVVRLPIYSGKRFLGLAIGVFDLPVLIKEALSGLDAKGVDIQLADARGTVFWGRENLCVGCISRPVSAADAQWTVGVGWKNGSDPTLTRIRRRVWLAGLPMLILLMLYVQSLRTRGRRLELQVAERTGALTSANERLSEEAAERRQVMQQLHESEARYRGLFEEAPLPIVVADPETRRVVQANQAFVAMLGYGHGDLAAMRIDEMHPEEARAEIIAGFKDSASREQAVTEALPCLTKGGERLYVTIRSAPVMMGGQKRVIGFFNDVTKGVVAEEALRASEERMALALEAVNDGLWDWRVDTNEVFYSSRWFTMLGYEPNELPQEFETWRMLLHPDDLAEAEAVIHDHLENGQPFQMEFRMRGKDGGWVWINARGKSVQRDDRGHPLRMLGTHQDITDRREAEQALKESELRYKLLHEASFGGITIHDKGLILDCNQGLTDISGYDREELIGMDGLLLIAEDSRPQVLANIRSGYEAPYEVFGLRKGGEVYPLRLEARNIPYQGRMVRSVEFRDITAQRRVEDALIEAKENAEAANKAKSEFLANMSHEIRTPMNGVLGMLQLMLSTELDTEQSEYANMALQSSMRLTRLLTDVLDLAKVEAGRLMITPEPFDLPALLGQVAELFEPAIRQYAVPLRVYVQPDVPRMVVGDATRLQQVLSNLIGNALKFTPEGQVMVEAAVLGPLKPGTARILFTVADTGIGIPDQVLAHLFKPFTQATQGYRRNHQGAGLGLSICKRLVELMGGSLCVNSEEGKGTEIHFSLTLPLAAEDQAGPRPEMVQTGPSPRQMSLLLAEDDRVSALAARRLLEKLGHTVTVANHGGEALEALAEKAYNLVFMDVQMPMMDGVEATRRIRSGEAGEAVKDVPIVAMTAYAMVGDREKFLEAGMNGYLAKPVEMAELRRVLEQFGGVAGGRGGRESE